jgi:hypothetical protein
MSKNTKEFALFLAKVINSINQAIQDKDSSALAKIQYFGDDLFAAGPAFDDVGLIGAESAEQTEDSKLEVRGVIFNELSSFDGSTRSDMTDIAMGAYSGFRIGARNRFNRDNEEA